MSKCMTLADETIEQKDTKDTCKEIDAKDIVEFILEEALVSAVIFSDKGCNRIGDFNITEDFSQQFDEIPANSKNFEIDKIKPEQDSASKDVNFHSGEIVDHFVSLVTAKENLELILDSLPKKDEKFKSVNECKIISAETLADNELRIENGQIHIEKNNCQKSSFLNEGRREFYEKEDVIKDEKIEIEYFNDGKLNKIYVPLSKASLPGSHNLSTPTCQQDIKEEKIIPQENLRNDANETEETTQRPFTPFSTEELRQSILQVWENANSSIVGGWDGDMSTQPEEVVRLMEELSSVQVFSDSSVDPNRPRTCAFGEEDVKKMIREIEEINFNQSHNTLEDLDVAYHPDGQGDADLDTKSFAVKSKESIGKSFKADKDQEEPSLSEDLQSKPCTNQSDNSLSNEKKNEEVLLSSQSYAKLNDSDERIKDDKENGSEGTVASTEKLVRAPSLNPDVEEYLIESESSSDRSILITNSENERSDPGFESLFSKKSLDNVNLSLGSEKETGQESQKVCEEKSFDSSEEITQNSLLGSNSFEEKGDDVMAHRLNSIGEINVEERPANGEKAEGSLSSPCFGNTIQISGHFNSLPKSKTNLRKSHKKSDLSLLSSNTCTESNVSNVNSSESVNISTEDSSSNLVDLSDKSTKNVDELWDDGKDPNLLSQDSKLFTKKISQDSVEEAPKNEFQNFSTDFELKNEEGNLKRLESKSNNIFEEVGRVDSFTGQREIEVPFCDANSLDGVNKESSVLEIVITKSENPSLDTDLSREKLTQDFDEPTVIENIVNRNSNHSVFENSLKKENQTIKEANSDKQEDENRMCVEIKSLDDKELEKNFLTSQKEENTSETETPFGLKQQTFKLHSPKMYLGSDLEPSIFEENKFILTDSEEAFIDSTENVIQVIDPQENSNDEDSETVSFSLLNEISNTEPSPSQTDRLNISDMSISSNKEEAEAPSENENILRRNVFSGMTTIGPMKNLDLDPKDLAGPEIDFGKMTRISSSRQLAKDIFSTEMKSVSSERTIEEQDSDGESSITLEGDRLEIGSLINRDIASLTKVQKVKEVMSYHPKADEDFEDDDTLTRPRLDLKDVESMTDERYKMTDVNIPLLSFEVGDSNSETDKEYLQGMHLVLSGNCFSNNPYYEDDFDEGNIQTYRNRSVVTTGCEKNSSGDKKMSTFDAPEVVSINSESRKESENSVKVKSKTSSLSREISLDKSDSQEQVSKPSEKSSQDDCTSGHHKYGTLGSVFKKASSKLIRKEGENLSLRNSKSLPRDTSRITASESIRFILEDCHSSATNVLKKSRSLLKNTQSIFKTMSQNRFGAHGGSSSNLNKPKMATSDSETGSNLERKPSAFQWKEDFSKAKTLIKNKVEKTFKTLDRTTSHGSESDITSENKDLRLAIRNEENYRVDRAENFRKLLPKSPLIYKSQFVRSQMDFQSNSDQENFNSVCTSDEPDCQQEEAEENYKIFLDEKSSEKTFKKESNSLENEDGLDLKKEFITSNEEKASENDLTWAVQQGEQGEVVQSRTEENEPQQPEYIVMDTVQGLPTIQLENSSYETDYQKDKKSSDTRESKDASESNQIEVSNYPQYTPTCCSTSLSDFEEDKNVTKTSPEKKIRIKNKKFTARFRSFWSSAFGKVKTSPKNKDPS